MLNTEKTVANYEKAFRTYKSTILNNNTELESKSKQISELRIKVDSLNKEVQSFKKKYSVLLTKPNVFASEKKKYLDSVTNILEREIRFERYRYPNIDRTENQKLISEMGQIAQKVCQENNIPFTAINEIFKDSEVGAQLWSLLRSGGGNEYHTPDLGEDKKRKKRKPRL